MKHYLQQLYLFAVLFIISCNKDVDKLTVDEKILLFKINNIEGVIDEASNTIRIQLPYETNLKNLIPEISLSGTPQVVPAIDIPQNFNSIVYYTLIGNNGAKKVYKVVVEVETQPSPYIYTLSTDSVEAGFDFDVVGKNFGSFPLDIKIEAVKGTSTFPLKFIYQSDSTLKVKTSIDEKPDVYKLKISVKNKTFESSQSFQITQPAPQLISANRHSFFPPDELKILTKYLDPSKFTYSLTFSNGLDSNVTRDIRINKDTVVYKFPSHFKAGKYTLQLNNVRDTKSSRENNIVVEVFSGDLPFARLISQNEYKVGEHIEFKAHNYTVHPYRFYQVNLSSATHSYVQNGVFDSEKSLLSIQLPPNMKKGSYSISHSLSDPSKNLRYNFTTDDTVIIK